MNGTENSTAITTREGMDIFQHAREREAELRKNYQLTLPAIYVELNDFYDEGWAYTETNSYYFDHSTDMIEFVNMILNDTEGDF